MSTTSFALEDEPTSDPLFVKSTLIPLVDSDDSSSYRSIERATVTILNVGEVSELCDIGLVVGDNIVVIDGGGGWWEVDVADRGGGWWEVDVIDGGRSQWEVDEVSDVNPVVSSSGMESFASGDPS